MKALTAKVSAAHVENYQQIQRLEIVSPGTISLVPDRLPTPEPHQVLARTVVSAISQGTEMAWYHGDAVALRKGWDRDRRIFTSGSGRAYPVTPGYESVGRIVAVGAAVQAVKVGDLINVDAPHASGHVIDEQRAITGLVPSHATAEQALFAILARVALGGVHDAALQVGDTVVVTGLGVVGLLAVQLAHRAGAQVIAVDRHRLRVRTAEAFGATGIVTGPGVDVAAQVRDLIGDSGADAAIEASGAYPVLHEAIRCVRVGGRVATVASYQDAERGLRLGEEYHRNRITLISSMTINGCAHRQHPMWTLDRLNDTARDLIFSGQLDTGPLITHRIPFTRAEKAYALLNDAPETTIKVVLTHDDHN